MPKFAANLMYLFQEWPLMERFQVARESGFKAVEYNFPYDADLGAMQEALFANGLEMVLINAPPGNFAAGDRGIAASPERKGEFEDSIGEALGYARELGCHRIHIMSGVVTPGDPVETAMTTYADNMKFAARKAAAEGVMVLVEPLNATDVPNYLINNVLQARALIAMTGEGNVALQFDAYHALMSEADPLELFRANMDIIGHVQVAGCPGRNEPAGPSYTGQGGFFETLDILGYAGWVGCEYRPKAGTMAGLGWASPYGISV